MVKLITLSLEISVICVFAPYPCYYFIPFTLLFMFHIVGWLSRETMYARTPHSLLSARHVSLCFLPILLTRI